MLETNNGKKNLQTKFKKKCWKKIPQQEQGERQGVVAFMKSNLKVCACALGIDSKSAVSRLHCTQGLWPFQRSREKSKFIHNFFSIKIGKTESSFFKN